MRRARSISRLAPRSVGRLGGGQRGRYGEVSSTTRPDSTSPASPSQGTPTVRLYALSNLAGALEPCGCTKDQLGGIDHLAAFLTRDRPAAHGSLFLAAGPTFFVDPKLEEKRSTQDRWKAETISASLGELGLSAWTPGYNDWAGGAPLFATLAKTAQGPLVAANLDGAVGAPPRATHRD
jgi:2',3'-cyclic-nucleotide 2'-phosphodiesterase (5'-nucleotidase family)